MSPLAMLGTFLLIGTGVLYILMAWSLFMSMSKYMEEATTDPVYQLLPVKIITFLLIFACSVVWPLAVLAGMYLHKKGFTPPPMK